MKIHSVEAELFQADRQTDRHDAWYSWFFAFLRARPQTQFLCLKTTFFWERHRIVWQPVVKVSVKPAVLIFWIDAYLLTMELPGCFLSSVYCFSCAQLKTEKKGKKKRTDLEKSIKEAKFRIGL